MKISSFLEISKEPLIEQMDEREADRSLKILLQELRACSSSDLVIHKDEELTPDEEEWLEKAIGRLKKGEPLQYVLGHEEFHGLELNCDRRALIPRPETEELVEKAIQSMKGVPKRILDLGTGNGCIALALKQAFPEAEVHAVDNSEKALALARENVLRTDLELLLHSEELYAESLQESLTFDLVVSNPPYVAPEERDELERNVLDHEPEGALFSSDDDPFGPYRSVLRTFCEKGDPGALLWMELNPVHADRVLNLMKEYDLDACHIEADLSGKRRFATGSL